MYTANSPNILVIAPAGSLQGTGQSATIVHLTRIPPLCMGHIYEQAQKLQLPLGNLPSQNEPALCSKEPKLSAAAVGAAVAARLVLAGNGTGTSDVWRPSGDSICWIPASIMTLRSCMTCKKQHALNQKAGTHVMAMTLQGCGCNNNTVCAQQLYRLIGLLWFTMLPNCNSAPPPVNSSCHLPVRAHPDQGVVMQY